MKPHPNGHRIKERSDCNCRRDDERCPTCDWGLGVCADCGMAEVELDEPCPAVTNREPTAMSLGISELNQVARSRSAIRVHLLKSNAGTEAAELDPVVLSLIDSGYRVVEKDDDSNPNPRVVLLVRD